MNALHVCKWCAVGALLALGSSLGLNRAISAQPPPPPVPVEAEEGVQVLTRGPVHEAFAETVTFDPEPGIVVTKAPPAAIEELPPDQRPEGDNVAWIPGYWGWDDERSDFLWISGIWRALPPGRQWVPGYWGKTEQGYQWTSGYWADATATEVQYLPEPPATVETGPNVAAPSADNTWLPGCWVWHQSRYVWRPGYWAAVQPNWGWVPAHYVYAPSGYVFVDGYWDYSIGRRGLLFAPVYFNAGIYARRGFSYSPRIVIDLGVFSSHLFVRPQYQHYYFGDYYAANYRGAGFLPSYAYNSGRLGYDPIYAHDHWQHRQDPQWDRRVAADFQSRREHENLRPPRTWEAQRALGATAAASRDAGLVVAAPLDQLTKSKDSRMRFETLDASERQKIAQHGQDVQKLRDERRTLEARAAVRPTEKPSKEFVPARVKLPGSPIVAKPVAELGKDHVPPKLYEAPKPDPNVAPKPRGNRIDQPKPLPKSNIDLTPKPLPKSNVDLTPKPLPKIEHATPTPKPLPKVERLTPTPKPLPKVERLTPTPQPQPKIVQPTPTPHPQPKVEHLTPQPKVEHPTPQPQPKAERPTGPGPKEDKHKGKD